MLFSEKLSLLMFAKGISASKLARDLNVHTSTVTGWKSGERTPHLVHMKSIADYFSMTMDEMYGEDSA